MIFILVFVVYLYFISLIHKLNVPTLVDLHVEMFCFQPEDPSGQLDYRYDEFGFKVEEEGTVFFPVH